MHSSEGRNMGIIIHYMECLIYTVMLCTIMIPFIGIEVITIHTQQPIAYPTPSLITFVPFPFLSPLSYHQGNSASPPSHCTCIFASGRHISDVCGQIEHNQNPPVPPSTPQWLPGYRTYSCYTVLLTWRHHLFSAAYTCISLTWFCSQHTHAL